MSSNLTMSLSPTPGGGKKKSRVGGVAAGARPVKKVEAPAETLHWPPFFLVGTPSDYSYCLLLCYNACLVLFIFVRSVALFPAKPMVPPPSQYSAILRRLRHRITFNLAKVARPSTIFSLFLLILFTFSLAPHGPSVSVLFESVVSSLIHRLDVTLLDFCLILAPCLYPLRAFPLVFL